MSGVMDRDLASTLTELVEFVSSDDDITFCDLNLTAATYIYPSDTEDKSWS